MIHAIPYTYRRADKSLARATSRCILFDGENISFDASLVIYIYSLCVEIKCQLDATEVFIADFIVCSTCFGHHYAHHQELKSIIQWLPPVVFRAVVFK